MFFADSQANLLLSVKHPRIGFTESIVVKNVENPVESVKNSVKLGFAINEFSKFSTIVRFFDLKYYSL